MKVLVIGGTRGTGREVVAAAHAAGHELTLLARNAERISLPVTGVRVVVGDAGDADDIERAVAGQDAVVWTAGVGPTRRPAASRWWSRPVGGARWPVWHVGGVVRVGRS